jgi:hypothetical protein
VFGFAGIPTQPENLICTKSSSSSSRIPAKPPPPAPPASSQMTRKNTVLHLKNPFVYFRVPLLWANKHRMSHLPGRQSGPTLRQKSRPAPLSVQTTCFRVARHSPGRAATSRNAVSRALLNSYQREL